MIHRLALALLASTVANGMQPSDDDAVALQTLSVAEYGVEVRVPEPWKLVARAEGSMVFGYSIANDDRTLESGVKCEIAAAPESLDEYRTRIDRRAERQQVPGLSLQSNQLQPSAHGTSLVTHWTFVAKDRPAIHDFEWRIIAHEQLYIFTLRAPEPVFEPLRARFEQLITMAKLTAPDTGLELSKDGFCVQKKFRFGLKLPPGWRPSFPLSEQSLFWATAKPKGIWSDNLLVVAAPAQPLDLDALAETVPDRLRREDPNCTVHSCRRVTQGKSGDALETVVETQRGPFRITVLERRYTGRRYNYEIKFTVSSETFEQSAAELRKSADSFVEFIAPQDLKGDAT